MVKTRSKAALLRSLANNQGLAINLAENQLKYGDWRELFRRIDKIDAVTNEDVKRVANEVFVETNRTVGILETTRRGERGTAMRTKILMAAMSAALLLGSPAWTQATRNDAPNADCEPPKESQPTGSRLRFPRCPPFNPQQPKRVVLPNGMIVFLTENHELPLISGSAMIRGGSDSEPADKTGLVELYGETWRTGGTEKLSGDQLDDYLEARAAKVETGGGDADTSDQLQLPEGGLPRTCWEFSWNLLRHPAFREDKLALAKKQMDSSISRRNDETDDIAQMQTDILGYGKAQRLCAGSRVCNRCGGDARGPAAMAQAAHHSEQHHLRRGGRLRLQARWRRRCARLSAIGPRAKRLRSRRSRLHRKNPASTWWTKAT